MSEGVADSEFEEGLGPFYRIGGTLPIKDGIATEIGGDVSKTRDGSQVDRKSVEYFFSICCLTIISDAAWRNNNFTIAYSTAYS